MSIYYGDGQAELNKKAKHIWKQINKEKNKCSIFMVKLVSLYREILTIYI